MQNYDTKYLLRNIVISIIVSIACILGLGFLYIYSDINAIVVALAFVVVCTAAQALIWGLSYKRHYKYKRILNQSSLAQFENITFDVMQKADFPVLILDSDYRTVWYNKAFSLHSGSKISFYGKHFDDFSSATIKELLSFGSEDGIEIETFKRKYKVKSYTENIQGNEFVVTIWNDQSEIEALVSKMHAKDVQIAYIVIDNLDEILRFEQEKYRSAALQVEETLKEWADSVNGIFKEYEREKFIFVFEGAYLQSFIDSKFDILDKVRRIVVGESQLPITISVGMSGVGESLTEKEKNAQTALNMALQRGGDQVVVKYESDNEIYGGRIQGVQNQSKVRARVFADRITTLIKESSNVIVMSHIRPDFDAIASSVGMARLCFHFGVDVNIVTNLASEDFRKCRELLSDVPEYADNGIFVDATQGQELIRSNSLLVVCDVSNPSQYEAPDLINNFEKIVVIDHHRKPGEDEKETLISYIDTGASSTSELVCEILENYVQTREMPRGESNLLLAGIMLDSKQFMRNTGTRTFGAALFLRSEGANPTISQSLFSSSIDEIINEADFEKNVFVYRDCIAIAKGNSGIGGGDIRIAAAKAADKLLSVERIGASFVICPMENYVHISGRSTGKINVQLILEKLGGGGHYESAATQLANYDVDTAIEELKEAIDAYFDNAADTENENNN